MIEIDFKKIELEDKDLITHYFKHHTSRRCRAYIATVPDCEYRLEKE